MNNGSFRNGYSSFDDDEFQCQHSMDEMSPLTVDVQSNETKTCDRNLDEPAPELEQNYETSFQNVSRLMSTISNQLRELNDQPNKECFQPHLDKLYGSLLKSVSILPNSSFAPNLASLAKKSLKRKLSDSDKQLRLVANPKSKAGRKPSKQLAKPDTPKKKELFQALLNPVKRCQLKPSFEMETAPLPAPLDKAGPKSNSKKPKKRGRPSLDKDGGNQKEADMKSGMGKTKRGRGRPRNK